MQFSCNTKALSEALSVTSRAVAAKTSLPALEGIYLKANENQVIVRAYNLELGISTTLAADCKEDGEIVLNAKLFSGMVRRIPTDTLTIQSNNKLLTTITSGTTEFTILGTSAEEFPELPTLTDGTALHLPENILSSMIKQTIFAVSTDESNPIHTGILFELHDQTIRLVAVDGFRLAIRTEKIEETTSLSFVVPGKTLNEIFKMLHAESEDVITLTISEKHLSLKINQYTLISRLLEGQFLDYKSVLSGTTATTIKINTRNFINSIDRASLLITDRLKSPVRCTFKENHIHIHCSSSIGKIYDEIDANIEGDDCEIGFNNHYLLDALRAADTDEIRVELSGALAPMKIYPPENDDFIFLVLPVRLTANA